jgi:glycosyltransferase involved in cell wall biosynthesis
MAQPQPVRTVSIIMPVYNERELILASLERVLSADTCGLALEVIVVDDGSTDGTREVLERIQRNCALLRVLFHPDNKGKGAALRTGFRHAKGDVIIVQDADLEYDPVDYPKLLAPILDNEADVVYGSRFLGGRYQGLGFWHFAANKLLTILSNALTGLHLTDMETGYKVFRRDVLHRLTLRSDRFGFEPEVTVKIARLGCRIAEVPISYRARSYNQGKKLGWKDAIDTLYTLVRHTVFG